MKYMRFPAFLTAIKSIHQKGVDAANADDNVRRLLELEVTPKGMNFSCR
jgi:hypothetical protein